MAKNSVIKAISFMKDRLKESGLNISKIVIFGSQARGNAKEESDVDVIIVSDDFSNKNIFKRAELTKDAEILTIRKFMIPFDIITLTTEELENDESLISGYAKGGRIVF